MDSQWLAGVKQPFKAKKHLVNQHNNYVTFHAKTSLTDIR